MKVRLVNICSDQVIGQLRNLAEQFNQAFERVLSDEEFGAQVEDFVIAVVAVDDDEEMNLRFCKDHKRAGVSEGPTEPKSRYVSIPLPLAPSSVAALSPDELRAFFVAALLRRLRDLPPKRTYKGFDYPQFVARMEVALAVFSAASFAAD